MFYVLYNSSLLFLSCKARKEKRTSTDKECSYVGKKEIRCYLINDNPLSLVQSMIGHIMVRTTLGVLFLVFLITVF